MVSKQFILKAGAAIIILAFVIELFFVYSYSQGAGNQTPPPNVSVSPQSVEYIGPNASFVVSSFSDSFFFNCGNASITPGSLENVLGKPIKLGSLENSDTRYLVKAVNSTVVGNKQFVENVTGIFNASCNGNFTLLRRAFVGLNTSSPLRLYSTSNQSITKLISARQFDRYRDSYGAGPSLLVDDSALEVGSQFNGAMRVVIAPDGSLEPGSLLIQQYG